MELNICFTCPISFLFLLRCKKRKETERKEKKKTRRQSAKASGDTPETPNTVFQI